MKNHTQTISDDGIVEVQATFNLEQEDYEPTENQFGRFYPSDIESVEVIIAGKGIDITKLLSEKQKDKIIKEFNYEYSDDTCADFPPENIFTNILDSFCKPKTA